MLIKAKIFVGSKKQGVFKKDEQSFEIKVKSKPEMGRASHEAAELLADYFNIPLTSIKLIKGHRQRNKIFNVNL